MIDKGCPQGPLILMAAMGVELSPFRRQLRERQKHDVGILGTLWGTKVLLIRTGMGREAASFCERLAPLKAVSVLSLGIAGALDESLKPGDVIIGRDVWKKGRDPIPTDKATTGQLEKAARRARVLAHTSRLATADQFVDDKTLRRRLRQETKALSVDMETYAMASYAQKQGLPFVALRSISDGADKNALAMAALHLSQAIGQYEKIIHYWLSVMKPFSS